MRFPLLVLLLLPAAARGQDPVFVLASRDRQRTVRGFEVSLSIKTEWRNVRAAGSDGRADLTDTGTAKLTTSMGRFWYVVDVPVYDPRRGEITRRREERAFDGTRLYVRNLDPVNLRTDPAAGQRVYEQQSAGGWGDPFLPLEWVYHGVSVLFSPDPDERAADPMAWRAEAKPTGREERINGRRCVEVARAAPRPGGRGETLWFDAEYGYMPVKVLDTTIESGPHPTLRWVPTGWTSRAESLDLDDAGGFVSSERVTTVTVDSLDQRLGLPAARFAVAFPAGSRVTHHSEGGVDYLTVAEDGALVPEAGDPSAGPPSPEPPSVGRTLAVVGVTGAAFAGLVVLLRRLGRSPASTPTPR